MQQAKHQQPAQAAPIGRLRLLPTAQLAPQEVEESAAMGADAVLLIADALEDGQLREMVAAAKACRVAALVEAHTAEHAERALAAGAELVGINNRNLATLRTDIHTALKVIPTLRRRPSSRVRSRIESASVLLMPRRAMMIASASRA